MGTIKKTGAAAAAAAKSYKSKVKKSMSPNASSYTVDRKSGSATFKVTNDKGKYAYISTSKYSSKDLPASKGHLVNSVEKKYTAFDKPTYEVISKGSTVKGREVNLGKDVVGYTKSIDTTGYSKGKKAFTEISKKKVPGSNDMYKITKRKVGRKDVKPIINKMKNAASKSIKKNI